MSLRIEASGAAEPATVWERYTRPSLWATWAPQIRRVVVRDRAPDEPIAPGVRGVVHGPLVVRVPFEVVDVDAVAHRWTWRVGVGPAAVTMDHGVEAIAGGHGSTAWVEIHLPAPIAAGYAPIARLALRRAVA